MEKIIKLILVGAVSFMIAASCKPSDDASSDKAATVTMTMKVYDSNSTLTVGITPASGNHVGNLQVLSDNNIKYVVLDKNGDPTGDEAIADTTYTKDMLVKDVAFKHTGMTNAYKPFSLTAATAKITNNGEVKIDSVTPASITFKIAFDTTTIKHAGKVVTGVTDSEISFTGDTGTFATNTTATSGPAFDYKGVTDKKILKDDTTKITTAENIITHVFDKTNTNSTIYDSTNGGADGIAFPVGKGNNKDKHITLETIFAPQKITMFIDRDTTAAGAKTIEVTGTISLVN